MSFEIGHCRQDSSKGFTLVEVLLAVTLLALGTLFIQEGFLRSAALYGRYKNTLEAQLLADEKLWDARNSALYESPPKTGTQSGTFNAGGKLIRWRVTAEQSGTDLITTRVETYWDEGGVPVTLVREAYATKPKPAA